MGENRLCLSQGLSDEAGLQLDVLTHEAIHVVQDFLDGLETPSSSTISLMLQVQGGFSRRLQRQREVEAYALQSQTGMVESLLARHC